jgi:diketogulonate reductase-like aldo/keto reductase
MGFVVLPKAGRLKHIRENWDIQDFELSEEEMQQINDMNRNERCTWNPESIVH